ncbi:BgTH12-01831 [Blumeria graminis f. sp. triticale]|uniref:Bgt-51877 n=2 Tax=Blumeria graminis TaxID=34373 RepID=A0A9X9MF59_BLUGR|nr:BgTH12-01831 [Blumeria graminis f. sp. triticale]VDB84131.1 Bgt-51877 [Blumeria graminis f. sp. tritici]
MFIDRDNIKYNNTYLSFVPFVVHCTHLAYTKIKANRQKRYKDID